MTESEFKITEYLIKKYDPKAIILHGSRATGFNRENSDWDLYVFVKSGIEGGSESYEGQNLDIKLVPLPLEQYDLIGFFGTTLRGAKILYDPEDFAQDLIAKASSIYEKGVNLSDRDLLNRKNRGHRLLERVQGTQENSELQFYHLGVFYEAVVRYWFELRNEWQQPPYQALPYIKERDEDFYKNLITISSSSTAQEKATAASNIYNKLFMN